AGGTVNTADFVFTTISTNANLSALSLSGGTLTPAFSSGTTSYTSTVANAFATVTVTPTAADATAAIRARCNGAEYVLVPSGSASNPMSLNVGTNTIDVQVTAQDNTTQKVYSISVTRNTNYQDWAGGFGMSGANSLIAADYDGDKIRNILE